MKLITVKMPDLYVKGIDELVKAERYSSRSEVIRIAIRELLKRELWGEMPNEENNLLFNFNQSGIESLNED
ncbi:putative transcriptional regulators containing the CopG/Arc/MetJ DNA-binding domain [Caldisphaera lagunensis DSM 15908]|uniref:Putative transcriptional regulators containing the CopG/Arc/MetJ DNA-binding domain n=1 Tax=Caldisphaera lagunensis (strain DSM 15908 / JCM 11604 / ANMR 0165 / IC-154) TaxID=1056495 RepID=L0A9R7_CALLD|nr:ribbon-helix-helix domain-containing protein [Caldisphaera lagunensis]AFZ70159.1 putative transcriptional regulators containing the CopG/Arc/MetJ DNA-binding domain [Caldisphaera lagunensis DSM 15908]